MLTRKQHELLLFIHDHLRQDGVSPSFDEMKDALGLRSKSGIHRLITGLEERGFIRRLPHRARALEILKLPQTVGTAPPLASVPTPPSLPVPEINDFSPEVINGFSPSVIQGEFGQRVTEVEPGPESVSLPLYGKIAAGTPIEALRDQSNMIDVPGGMLGRGDYYALEVEGDSMIEVGIMDGDTVIIERGETAENGVIVVALVDGEEVTLKRIRRKGNSVALEAANPDYETRIFGPDRVQVQGKLAGLLRQY